MRDYVFNLFLEGQQVGQHYGQGSSAMEAF